MVTALILSGGTGTRLGDSIPKQYIEVEGRPIITYCIETLSKNDKIDAICIVAASEWQSDILRWLKEFNLQDKFNGFSVPGVNRQLSIYNGLCDIKKNLTNTDFVLIHDAARPMLQSTCIELYIDAVGQHNGVIPVLPVKDTMYLSNNGNTITGLLDRKQVFAGQAPEVFQLDLYLSANEQLINWIQEDLNKTAEISPNSKILEINGSTEPAILAGMDIVIVPGDEGNFKITTQEDLSWFIEIVKRSAYK